MDSRVIVRRTLSAAFAVFALLGLFLFLSAARGSGSFSVALELELAADVDRDSLRYTHYWKKELAPLYRGSLKDPDGHFIRLYEPPESSEGLTDIVVMPRSSVDYGMGLIRNYRQPEVLGVLYALVDDDQGVCRLTWKAVPAAHGDRQMTLRLPLDDN